jgi:MoxR-like ATPase
MLVDEKVLEKASLFESKLSDAYLEREETAEGILLSLLVRQHCLFIGPPGTAKSAMIDYAAQQIQGARYFRWLLTKFSTPEEVFGPVSLQALKNDSYRRKTADKLPEAHIAFLDEAFKANSAILNSLLSLMNERLFFNDGEPMRVPLITIFAASNELPAGDEEATLQALSDRFLLRYEVNYISSNRNKIALLLNDQPEPEPIMSMDDLDALHAAAKRIRFTEEAAETLVAIVDSLRREGIEVSDRRMKQSVLLLQAKALLTGANAVEPERDFAILQHAFWATPDQQSAVAQAIMKIANPAEAVLEETSRAIREAAEAAQEKDVKKKLVTIQRIKKLVDPIPQLAAKLPPATQAKAERMIVQAKEMIERLTDEVLAEAGVTE